MEYTSIRHKLNKYQNKLTLESNQYKKALYAEKVGHYRQLLQSGGTNLATIIGEGTGKLKDDVQKILGAFPASGSLDPKLVSALQTGIQTIQSTFGTYITDTLTATLNFAEYNSTVRDELRTILAKAKGFQPIDPSVATQLTSITNELQNLNIEELNYNQTIIGRLGVLAGSSTEDSIKKDINQLKAAFVDKKGKYNPLTIQYAQAVKTKLDSLIENNNVTEKDATGNQVSMTDATKKSDLKTSLNDAIAQIV
jgi:hypothetical protein